jgi:hypothetical protein
MIAIANCWEWDAMGWDGVGVGVGNCGGLRLERVDMK